MAGSVTAAVTQANNEFNQALSQQKGSTMDKESFMLLLVTQFKYQDPLNPMEDKEFIAQLAQFSSLEQMMNMNESIEQQTEAINNQQMINATSYIGKLVSVTGNTIGKATTGAGDERQTTVSTFRYAFGDNVVRGTLSVRDSSGNTIYTEDLAGKQAGTTFEFNWNGLTGAGEEAPDGVYVVSLSAFNSKGEAVLSDQVVDATVTGVINNSGTVMLGMDGGQMLSLANVRQVTTPKVVSSGTTDDKTEDADADDNTGEAESGGDSDVDNSGESGSVDDAENSGSTADSSGSGSNDSAADSGSDNAANNGVQEESPVVAPIAA